LGKLSVADKIMRDKSVCMRKSIQIFKPELAEREEGGRKEEEDMYVTRHATTSSIIILEEGRREGTIG